jgi:serine/threonine-protein kinase
MGRVYLGEHVKMNRQCAIKVMNPALVNDHESATRFAREASSAARIIHPNVAAVFDFGESEGLVYLVMEFVDGEPLSRILAREAPLSVERSVDITRQIADGLGAAHELGIIHRDLKPDNILIARTRVGKEVAKVVDFGIAKAMQETVGEALTRTGLVIGTPEFMSPEQLLGDPIDARSDLYALGCIMHLMLTAVPPFEAATREQMIKRRLAEDAPRVQAVDPSLPDSLDRIVARLLARNPAERYGSSAEVRDALSGAHLRASGKQMAIRGPVTPTPRSAPTIAFESLQNATTAVHESSTPSSASPAAIAPAPVASRRTRSRWLLPAAAGAVVVVGAAFAMSRLPGKPASAAAPVPADTAVRATTPTTSPTTSIAAGTLASNAVSKPGSPVSKPATPAARDSARRRAAAATAAAAAAKGTTKSASAAKGALDTSEKAQTAREKNRIRDSIGRVMIRDLKGTPASVTGAIVAFARALESRNMDRLKVAYRFMSAKQEEDWRVLFSGTDSIQTSLSYGTPVVTPTEIHAPFTMAMRMVTPSKQSINRRIAYDALFSRDGSAWTLREINQR